MVWCTLEHSLQLGADYCILHFPLPGKNMIPDRHFLFLGAPQWDYWLNPFMGDTSDCHLFVGLRGEKGSAVGPGWQTFHARFDTYSKHGFAFCAGGALASTTNQGLRKSLIHKHGLPHEIAFDQEGHYIGKVVGSGHMAWCPWSYHMHHHSDWWAESTGMVCWRSSRGAVLETHAAGMLSSKIQYIP